MAFIWEIRGPHFLPDLQDMQYRMSVFKPGEKEREKVSSVDWNVGLISFRIF